MSLARRSVAEGLGTAFLVAAVVGSGIAAQRLLPGDVGLQLLVNSIVTGAALVALILALQPVSAAFNPLVTLLERAFGAIDNRVALSLIGAQLAGGILGVIIANLMFGEPAVTISMHHRTGSGPWLGEVVATVGLMVVIFGAARTGRSDRTAYAVGAYIPAAYWFTSSTSFANPAVSIARTLSNTFAGIAPASLPAFLLAQGVGAVLAYPLIRLLYPTPDSVERADLVITMGCGDTCPYYPGVRYEDWDLPDPAGLDLSAVRPIRDEIKSRVFALIDQLR